MPVIPNEPVWWDITIPDGQIDPRISPQRGLAHAWIGHRHYPQYEGRSHPEAIPLGFEGTVTIWVDLPADFTPRNGWGTGPLNMHDSPHPNGWRGVSPIRIMMQPDGLGLYLEYTAGTESTSRRRRKVPIEPYIGAGPTKLTLHLKLSQQGDGYVGMEVNDEWLFPIESSPNMRPSDHELLAWAGYYYPATGEAGHTNPGTTRLRVSTPIFEGTPTPLSPPVFKGWWASHGTGGHPNATVVQGEPVGAPAPPPPPPPPPPGESMDITFAYGPAYNDAPHDLEGATVAGSIYIQANPQGTLVSGQNSMQLLVNGQLGGVGGHSGTENYAPWNFGTGDLVDTVQDPWVEGENVIEAIAYDQLDGNGAEIGRGTVTFTIDNVADPPPPPTLPEKGVTPASRAALNSAIADVRSSIADLSAVVERVQEELDAAEVIE